MNTRLLGNLKGDERENFKQSVRQAKKVLDKLREICYNIGIEKGKVEFTDYESPSWSHRQAHTNGYQEAIRDVLILLDIKDLTND